MKKVNISVNTAKSTGNLEHYWRYIGYDECNYTYIPEGKELLKKFAALEKEPYYSRTHFLFCTGNCHGTYKFGSTNLYTEDEDGNPVYDFKIFDMIMDAYLDTGIKPFVELGFMPMDLVDKAYLPGGRLAHNIYKEWAWACPPKDYNKWYDLIETVMRHLSDKYGADEIKTWYFELWNEPDIFYWKGSDAEYCKLFDYTEAAFHSVLPEGRLAGPATTGCAEGKNALRVLENFLDHCRNGVNFYSGKTGTRLDYGTFHVKGGGFPFQVNASKACPTAEALYYQVRVGLDAFKKYGYGDLEIVLSEADPDGWAAGGVYDNANMIFRNTEFYATYVASTYDKIERLGAEYGMSVKPLAWAFMFPGERCFEGTRTFSTQGIDKAVLNMFKIFAKLGHQKLSFESDGENIRGYGIADVQANGHFHTTRFDGSEGWTDVSGFAVKGDGGETQIVVYSHNDDRDIKGESEISLKVSGLGDKKGLAVTHYRIDAEHSNPYAEWVRQGSPWYPDEETYAKIKARDGLEKLCDDFTADSAGNNLELNFKMPTHGVSLIVIK